jgi:HCOMODA/2-hydroxy-3-carboxy-muconic semialdehyde decarboxylase
MTSATSEQQEMVRQAARGLARAGLVHAYGHCSLRLDAEHLLVCAAMPMGMIRDEPGTIVPINGPLPEGVLGEVRAHQAIYRLRPDVGGICRTTPPHVMTLSTQKITPRPRHGMGAYFAPCPPLWDNPRLLRDDESAAKLAETMGDAPAIVMRGNGAITAGRTLAEAVTMAVFLEDSARVERDVRAMGFAPDTGVMSEEEVEGRRVFAGGVIERMWAWITRTGD